MTILPATNPAGKCLPKIPARRARSGKKQAAGQRPHRAGGHTQHYPQGYQPSRNLGVAPSRQRHARFSRTAASYSRGLCAHLRGKNAEALPAVASLQYCVSLSNAYAISEHYGVCNPPPLLSADCSIPDGRGLPEECAPELPLRKARYESLPPFAVLVLLQLLTRWDTWALVRASLTSRPKYTSSQSLYVGANLRIALLSVYRFSLG